MFKVLSVFGASAKLAVIGSTWKANYGRTGRSKKSRRFMRSMKAMRSRRSIMPKRYWLDE